MNLVSNSLEDKKILTLDGFPEKIKFKSFGKESKGHLSVASEEEDIPFEVKRVYWTYGVPTNVTRGKHAHFYTEQVLIAINGTIEVKLEMVNDPISRSYVLDSPDLGLFIPARTWRELKYSEGAVQLVLASKLYSESDYIRNYHFFKNLNTNL